MKKNNFDLIIIGNGSLACSIAYEINNLKSKNLPINISSEFGKDFIEAYKIIEKQKRSDQLSSIRNSISEKYTSETLSAVIIADAIKNVENDIEKGCREKFEELSGAKVNVIVFPKQKDTLF